MADTLYEIYSSRYTVGDIRNLRGYGRLMAVGDIFLLTV